MWQDSGGTEKENICRPYQLLCQNREEEKEKISMVTARQLIIGTKPGDVVVLVKKGTRANQHLVLLAETRKVLTQQQHRGQGHGLWNRLPSVHFPQATEEWKRCLSHVCLISLICEMGVRVCLCGTEAWARWDPYLYHLLVRQISELLFSWSLHLQMKIKITEACQVRLATNLV